MLIRTYQHILRRSPSDATLCVGLLFLCVLIRLPFYFPSVIDWDESTFILMGQNILDGHLPYTQLWENKPPLAFVFFALALLFGKSIITVRIAGTVAVLASAYLTYRVGRNIWGQQTGVLAAILSIAFISLAHSGQATMTEIIVLVPIMGAVVVLLRGVTGSTCFWAGFLLSVAALTRLNLAYLAAAVGILIAYWSSSGAWRPLLRRTALYVLGGFLPLVIVALPYVIGGYQELFINSVFIAPLRYTNAFGSFATGVVFLIRRSFSFANIVLGTSFLGGLVYIAKNWSNYEPERKYGSLLIAIFLIGVGCSIVFTGAAHPHYLIQLVPFLSLVAASLFGWLLHCRYKSVLWVCLLIGFVQLAKPIIDEYVIIGKKLVTNRPLLSDEGYQIASYVSANNPLDEPIYMMTYHIVYWLVGIPPISKSVSHPSTIRREYLLKAILGPQASSRGEMIALLQKRPLYIVKNRETLYLTGEAAKILEDRLSKEYVLVKVINQAYIYRRRLNGDVTQS
jgi:4-amino-4-deoxy-L-arabinose transferase-like glycosyltransferase